jgi:hypothetical protein
VILFDAAPQPIETEAADYATGVAQLDELTPEGWQRLHIQVDHEV